MITLKTLPEATAQQVFDQAAMHLLTQGAKSAVDNLDRTYCRYRWQESKCAAGCFIGDDEYDPGMEGKHWLGLVEMFGYSEAHCFLIMDLQRIHDIYFPSQWPDLLINEAKEWHLSPQVVIDFAEQNGIKLNENT